MARRSSISAVMVALMGNQRHAWTLEELHEALSDLGRSINFSSVFRAAEKLVGEGVARKFLLADGRTRFELSSAHHDHLLCDRCGELVPVPCIIDHTGFSAIEHETGASILDHQLVLTGICGACNGHRQAGAGS
jgi:Fur family ferric uptake transcriptional regulator